MSDKTTGFGDWDVKDVVSKVDVGSEVSSQLLPTASDIVGFLDGDLTLEAEIVIGDEEYRDCFRVYSADSSDFYVYHVDEWDTNKVWLKPPRKDEYKSMVIDAHTRYKHRDTEPPVRAEGVDVGFGD